MTTSRDTLSYCGAIINRLAKRRTLPIYQLKQKTAPEF